MNRSVSLVFLLSLAACNGGSESDSTELTVSMSSVATAAGGASPLTLGPTANLLADVGDSHNLPVVDGMKVTLPIERIALCTGTYGTSANCDAAVVAFDAPVDVELTNEAGANVDLAAVGQAKFPSAGEYTHARICLDSAYSLKAYFKSGADTVYTTAAGLATNAGSAEPGADYDYLAYADLYPGQDASTICEVTFFSAPFVHDGTSALDVSILIDINRFGRFSSADTTATFVPTYPNLYVTFNEAGVSAVETYVLGDPSVTTAGDPQSVDWDQASALTLLFTESNSLIGARARFIDGMSIPPVGRIGQFLKDWTCTDAGECSFVAGDYGTGEFPQTGAGFTRQAIGSSDTFELTSDAGTSTLVAKRVAR